MIVEILKKWCLENIYLIAECHFSENLTKNECVIIIMTLNNSAAHTLGERLNNCIMANFPPGMKCQLTFLPFSLRDMKCVCHQGTLTHEEKLNFNHM